MRAELFVDSGAWFRLANPADPAHRAFAADFRDRLGRGVRPVTTNLVIAETHALLLTRTHRGAALSFLREVRRPPITVVVSDEELESRAQREWLERYADHDFSLTDAVSFEVMSARRIGEAFGIDRHFRAAGFTLVP